MSELSVVSDVDACRREHVRERRRRLVDLHRKGLIGELPALAREFGVAEQSLSNDWARRKDWLPSIVEVKDVAFASAEIVDEFDAVLRECWVGVERTKEAKSWMAYNGCLKNLRELLVCRGEFLQSLGVLPRMASEVKFEHSKEEVKVPVNRSDSDVLSAAARIWYKENGGQKQSGKLH